MALNRGSVLRHEVVVEPLVIGEIKPEFLQARLQAPIDLREKEEGRKLRAYRLNGFGPEFSTRGCKGGGERAPGFGKYIVEDEHRHITADAVAQASYALQFCEHGFAGGGIAVIKLDGIDPSPHVGVFPESQPTRAFDGFGTEGIGPLQATVDK